jgi:hypothetical protein
VPEPRSRLGLSVGGLAVPPLPLLSPARGGGHVEAGLPISENCEYPPAAVTIGPRLASDNERGECNRIALRAADEAAPTASVRRGAAGRTPITSPAPNRAAGWARPDGAADHVQAETMGNLRDAGGVDLGERHWLTFLGPDPKRSLVAEIQATHQGRGCRRLLSDRP